MRRIWSSFLGVVAVGAILVGINMLADARLANVQLDLTAQRLYTLSPGTKAILAGLKQPVTLRMYYSRQLGSTIPLYGAYADRVREVLEQYAAAANGKLRLEFYDPEPYSDTEDRALALGLQGVPVDQSGTQVYFGVAGSNQLDTERNIPFLQPDRERFLEYDLTRLVYELSDPTRLVVGLMTSAGMDGDPEMMMMAQQQGGAAGRPWVSIQQLRQSFDVKDVESSAQVIDPDIKVLLVAQAQHLSDNTLYTIDQFVMRGGRLMVMVDPHSEAEAATPDPAGQPRTDTSSDLAKLFDAWGIQYDPKTVVGDLTGAWQVRGSPTDKVQAVSYVAWFNIRDGLSHDDPATADLSQITVAAAGAIAKKPGTAIDFIPLLTSSGQSALLPVAVVENNPDPGKILGDFKPAGGPRVIAARVRGVLHSAFTGPPPLDKGDDGKPLPRPDHFPDFKAQTDGPANLVVVADSDILADRFWVQTQNFFGQQLATPFSDNAAFVANLLGTLGGNDALLGLRSRGAALRPFDMVDRMQQQAEARFRQTEEKLQAHLDDTQKQLTALRTSGSGGTQAASPVLTEQQQEAITQLRRDVVATREQLRHVQLELRRDISTLETKLQLFDIALVPAILALLAILLGVVRGRRRARARS